MFIEKGNYNPESVNTIALSGGTQVRRYTPISVYTVHIHVE